MSVFLYFSSIIVSAFLTFSGFATDNIYYILPFLMILFGFFLDRRKSDIVDSGEESIIENGELTMENCRSAQVVSSGNNTRDHEKVVEYDMYQLVIPEKIEHKKVGIKNPFLDMEFSFDKKESKKKSIGNNNKSILDDDIKQVNVNVNVNKKDDNFDLYCSIKGDEYEIQIANYLTGKIIRNGLLKYTDDKKVDIAYEFTTFNNKKRAGCIQCKNWDCDKVINENYINSFCYNGINFFNGYDFVELLFVVNDFKSYDESITKKFPNVDFLVIPSEINLRYSDKENLIYLLNKQIITCNYFVGKKMLQVCLDSVKRILIYK